MGNSENDTGAAAKLRQTTILVALRTGLLKKCPEHGEVYDSGQYDYQGASMVATFLINSGSPLVDVLGGDRAPLLEALRSICKSYGKACPVCSRPATEGTGTLRPQIPPLT
jgi:hypothetical protein